MARPSGSFDVVLMIGFGRVEGRRRPDLGGDWRRESAGLIEFGDGLAGDFLLRVAGGPDAGAVLTSDVGSLPIDLRRVVHAEECVDKLAVGDAAGVEDDLDRLGVSGVAIADIAVGSAFIVALHIAAACVDDAVALLEVMLDAPEAPTGEVGRFGGGGSGGEQVG